MKRNNGLERREHSRISANFIVSYRITQPPSNYDLSQTKNVSQRGILLTTNRKFEKDTFLAMTIRFPFVLEKIEVKGVVVDSQEVIKNLIYDTRIKFFDLDVEIFRQLGEFVKQRLK